MAFFELRHYQTWPGKMKEWVNFMEQVIIPFQTARGMVIIGSFCSENEDSDYFWLRRFESEKEREYLYKAVYDSSGWSEDIFPKVGQLIDRSKVKVTRLVATSRSMIR